MENIKTAYNKLSPFNSKITKMVFDTIIDHFPEGGTVTEIYIKTRLKETNDLSQHLAKLKRQGYLTCEREGKNIWYYPDYEVICKVKDALTKFNN